MWTERCACGAQQHPGAAWCAQCVERSRSSAESLPFGVAGRRILMVAIVLLLVRGWWGIAMHWGSPQLLLDVLWVPPATAMARVWLRDLWFGPSTDEG